MTTRMTLPNPRGVLAKRSTVVLAACLAATMAAPAAAQSPAAGPTKLSDFQPFAPSDTVGAVPNLPKSIAFMVPAANEYYTDIGNNIKLAADARGLEYQLVSSESDPVKDIDQINSLLQRGVGCLVVQPQDAAAQGVVLQKAIDSGVHVNFLVTPPANTQSMADQYDLGYQQALTAVTWIQENLGGNAVVANMSLDYIEALIPRREGTEAGLATGGPGIKVIDVPVTNSSPDEGFQLASTLYQSNPDINVWIGPDDPILSVNAYLESVGKDPATDKIYLSALNGTQAGLDAVAAGDTFVRSVWGFNNSLFGYASGQICADWLEGKSVPQVIQLGGTESTNADEVAAFRAQLTDPAQQYQELLAGTQDGNKVWGETSFEHKDNYLRNTITGG